MHVKTSCPNSTPSLPKFYAAVKEELRLQKYKTKPTKKDRLTDRLKPKLVALGM